MLSGLRVPGILDMGNVQEHTNHRAGYTLQLRLEAYNAFNHANFIVNTGGAYISGGAGTITGSYGGIAGNFGTGNRNIQLGAKIVF